MDHNDKRDRDQQILSRLARIEHKVDSLDQTTAFALRADAKTHFASVMEIFGTSKRRVQIYLAVNGARSIQDIADHLGMKRQNVGVDLRKLSEEGLVEIIDEIGGKDIYAKKALDQTLRVSKQLQEKFNLDRDGFEIDGAKGKKKGVTRKGGGK